MDVTKASTQLSPVSRNPKLMAAAERLEASFLAEMFKASGVGEPRKTMGGGAGEDHFSSLLVQEYANATVAGGGIGLAESIYQAMVERGQTS